MSWEDRIRTAAYTSSDGDRVTFDFQDLNMRVSLRNTVFNFPGVAGSYVQPNERSARTYPIRAYFSGEDYDQDAAAFFALLYANGVGRLEHPFYGDHDVVPVGDIRRRDDLVTAANMAVIDVVFFETTGAVYPSSSVDLDSAISSATTAAATASSSVFTTAISLTTAIRRVTSSNVIQSYLDDFFDSLSAVAQLDSDISGTFTALYSSITTAMDTLIDTPADLADEITSLIATPAAVDGGVSDKLDAYSTLSDSIITDSDNEIDSVSGGSSSGTGGSDTGAANSARINAVNNLAIRVLFAYTYVAATATSITNGDLGTRDKALSAAVSVLDLLDTVTEWSDSAYDALDSLDTHEVYEPVQQAAALAAGYAINEAFNLKQRRVVTLDRDRTILDLAFEIFGSVDDELDDLITINNLTGSDIIELKRGRQIEYYV